jgi:hypothetical protein
VTLSTYPHLVPRSRMSRSYIFSPPFALMACSGTALHFSSSSRAIHLRNNHTRICTENYK